MSVALEQIQLTEEMNMFFSDKEEAKELGCIGHLRGDFGESGQEFWTSWFPHRNHELNDDGFKAVFDAVINELRKPEGLLHTRLGYGSLLPRPTGKQTG